MRLQYRKRKKKRFGFPKEQKDGKSQLPTLTRLADGFGLKAALPAYAGFTPKIGSPAPLQSKQRNRGLSYLIVFPLYIAESGLSN